MQTKYVSNQKEVAYEFIIVEGRTELHLGVDVFEEIWLGRWFGFRFLRSFFWRLLLQILIEF